MTLALLCGVALGGDALLDAALAEVDRAMSGLRLPDQPPPYFVGIEILDGDVATATASFGSLVSFDRDPYRQARVEVRVGDYQLDNGNFEGTFGGRSGVTSRGLPHDPVVDAFRREIWLGTDEAYKGATEQLAAKIAARRGDEDDHPADLSRIEPLMIERAEVSPVDGERIRAIVERLSVALGVADGLEQADAQARDWQGERLICTSEGTRAWLPTGFAVVRVDAASRAPDGAIVRDGRAWVARTGDLLPPIEEMEAEVSAMGAWIASAASAPVEGEYLGPVLFEPAASVELFRQLLAPEVSGTPPLERSDDGFGDPEADPVPVARLGRRLLPLGWSVVDDPTSDEDEAGAYTHDFEGVPARRVDLVKDGVVRDLLMSRVPRSERANSTGHGRSLGNERRIAMPAAIHVEPDKERTTKKLRKTALRLAKQAGLDYVIVVRRLVPLGASDDAWMSLGTGEGPAAGLTPPMEAYRLYPDGRQEPVRGLGFVGADRRVLREIVAAGDVEDPVGLLDSPPGPGRSSIGGLAGLPASWAVPAVVIAEMELQGPGGGDPRVVPMPPRL